MMKIINKIEINTSREKVFCWLEDPDRAKQWMTSVTKSEIVNKTPNKVGTTFKEYIEEDGNGIEMEGIITEFIPNKEFAVHLESKVNLVDVSFVLNENENITTLNQYVEMRFKGMLKILSVFMRNSIKKKIAKQLEREFAKLKELCERSN